MPEQEYRSPLQCPNCNGSIVLTFGDSTKHINEVLVSLFCCPTLRCSDCDYSTLPSLVLSAINKETSDAAEQGKIRGEITFRDNRTLFNFCEGVNFLYDYRDNLYFPGLFSGWDDGYLTPVFFNTHVLHKYRNSSNYRMDMASDTYGVVYFPDGEHLPFGINRRGEIIAWIGDIDLLPIDEQHYLRSENIESSHDIASEFYDGQIGAAFSELSREHQMFLSRAEFIRRSNTVTGLNTSLLDAEAANLLQYFSPPIDEGRRTIVDAFHDLHKVCVETISREAYSQDLSRRGAMFEPGLGSIKVLQVWIEKVLDCADAPKILCPLFVLDDLRKLEAHLIGFDTTNEILFSAISRLGLETGSNMRDIYEKLIVELHSMYDRLSLKISQLTQPN